ncbi:MAG: hypothetical protein QNJ63_02165 [Calothrix sp. MO_192.B10]|nr:hypothetical protein [Calothrix sp. MO_192.B10]
MDGKINWENFCEQIQQRTLHSTPLAVKSAKSLRAEIFKCLTSAYNEGFLNTKIHEIHSLLKMTPQSKEIIEITGGQRNFKRVRETPHFERTDGCWFDFAILVNQKDKSAEVMGFTFEIRFVDDNPIKFLRFDLNLPEHNNQDKGKRFHIHPGYDEFMIHSPPMSPLEILHLFLYDLYLPIRPRSS